MEQRFRAAQNSRPQHCTARRGRPPAAVVAVFEGAGQALEAVSGQRKAGLAGVAGGGVAVAGEAVLDLRRGRRTSQQAGRDMFEAGRARDTVGQWGDALIPGPGAAAGEAQVGRQAGR